MFSPPRMWRLSLGGRSSKAPKVTFIFKDLLVERFLSSTALLSSSSACHRKTSCSSSFSCTSCLVYMWSYGVLAPWGIPKAKEACVWHLEIYWNGRPEREKQKGRLRVLNTRIKLALTLSECITCLSKPVGGTRLPPEVLILCLSMTRQLFWHPNAQLSRVRFGHFCFPL